MSKYPKVTPERIQEVIADEHYQVMLDGRTTLCTLTLVNGFSVHGFASCVHKDNFDAEIGMKMSRKDAENRIWVLEGYLLAQRLHDEKNPV